MSSRRNTLAILGVVVIVVTTGCGAQQVNDTPSEQATSTSSKTGSTGAAKPTEVPSSEPTTLAPENAQHLESSLASSDKTEQALALIPDLRLGRSVLPAGSTLSIDQKSFRVTNNGYGTANATVTGSMQGEFVLHLALVGDQWLVYRTEKKG